MCDGRSLLLRVAEHGVPIIVQVHDDVQVHLQNGIRTAVLIMMWVCR
jgi:hypothetical protein